MKVVYNHWQHGPEMKSSPIWKEYRVKLEEETSRTNFI